MWRLALFLVAYLALVVAVGLFLGNFNLPRYTRLDSEGADTVGTVTETHCSNHNSFTYKYEVDGQEYVSNGNAGFGTPDCRVLRSGDKIHVRYLPADPATSVPGDIGMRLGNEWISVCLAAVVLPAFAAAAGVWRGRRATKNRA